MTVSGSSGSPTGVHESAEVSDSTSVSLTGCESQRVSISVHGVDIRSFSHQQLNNVQRTHTDSERQLCAPCR